ncbi:pyridine nucleotide-disulfide oxidoreductase [Chitinispirillum alkaliphilum]|nr:pyridine nucleotide-disulfide oxidoreductase [Chitinispirillum alkaliphilum]
MEKKAWICTVCEYVHDGDSPPDVCPLCGVTSESFELVQKTEKNFSETIVNQGNSGANWRCVICDYVSKTENPPETCPVCGASAENFKQLNPADSASVSETKTGLRIVIVGSGIAGVSAAESARKSSPDASIILISKENHLPYYRINLTRYLAGEISEDKLLIHPGSWYSSKKITLMLNKELSSIDYSGKKIRIRGGDTLEYDKLIVTTGAHPFVPPILGASRENVTVFRTKDNADFINRQCKLAENVVVIGGGTLGIETAGAIAKAGKNVTVIEECKWLIPRQLNEKAALMLERFVNSLGVKLIKNVGIKQIAGDDTARGVELIDGRIIPAELVVITTGIKSNAYMPKHSGLETNCGIVVNDYLESSVKDVFAAGDVTEHRGLIYGLWGPAQFQGAIAGKNAAGEKTSFVGIPISNFLKVLGYDMFSVGKIYAEGETYRKVENSTDDEYQYFLFENNCLVGAIHMGKIRISSKVKSAIEKRTDCSDLLKDPKVDVNAVLEFLKSNKMK